MLELRPNCEYCDKDLPPQSDEARICSYECTYCADCVETVLHNVCPTCGGGFAPRPIRPRRAWRPALKLGLENQSASDRRRQLKFSHEDVAAHVARIRNLPRRNAETANATAASPLDSVVGNPEIEPADPSGGTQAGGGADRRRRRHQQGGSPAPTLVVGGRDA